LQKLSENFQNISKVALESNSNKHSAPQILELEKRVLELSLQIKQEQEEKSNIKQELVSFKNKVEHLHKRDPGSVELNEKMNKVLSK